MTIYDVCPSCSRLLPTMREVGDVQECCGMRVEITAVEEDGSVKASFEYKVPGDPAKAAKIRRSMRLAAMRAGDSDP